MLNSTDTHTALYVQSFLLTSSKSSSFGEVSGLNASNELTFVVHGVPAHKSRLPLSTLRENQRGASERKLIVRSIVCDRNTPKKLNVNITKNHDHNVHKVLLSADLTDIYNMPI